MKQYFIFLFNSTNSAKSLIYFFDGRIFIFQQYPHLSQFKSHKAVYIITFRVFSARFVVADACVLLARLLSDIFIALTITIYRKTICSNAFPNKQINNLWLDNESSNVSSFPISWLQNVKWLICRKSLCSDCFQL